MLNDIYNKRIIELAGNIPRLGRLPAPDASATAHSKLCGSTVKIDLTMDGPVVTDFAHEDVDVAIGFGLGHYTGLSADILFALGSEQLVYRESQSLPKRLILVSEKQVFARELFVLALELLDVGDRFHSLVPGPLYPNQMNRYNSYSVSGR